MKKYRINIAIQIIEFTDDSNIGWRMREHILKGEEQYSDYETALKNSDCFAEQVERSIPIGQSIIR